MEKERDPPFKWVPMESNNLPENALAAGKDQSNTFNVYVGRGEIDGEIHVGKVHNGTRYIGYRMGGREEVEVTSEKFSVLCVDQDAEVEWVEFKDVAHPHRWWVDGNVKAGNDGIREYFVGRGIIENRYTPSSLIPGIFTPLNGGFYELLQSPSHLDALH